MNSCLQDDRVSNERVDHIGRIEIVCKAAIPNGYRILNLSNKNTSQRGALVGRSSFQQATKNDCATALGGKLL